MAMVRSAERADAAPVSAPHGTIRFKYRYVPSGTRFTAASGERWTARDGDNWSLYENEVAVGVGYENWCARAGENVVIDHHADGEPPFPSSSVAVIHKAGLLRKRTHDRDSTLIWLVTQKRPTFDCYTAMYLARWFMEDASAAHDFAEVGLPSEGFTGDRSARAANGRVKYFDWFKPNFTRFPEHVHWAVLLASFAAHTDRAGRIPCPRNRALHSILYAAVHRGRPYWTEDNGAQEFFDAVRRAMHPGDFASPLLNPLYDSVLENDRLFAPELALLDVQVKAYERDIARARKAVVFLPTLPPSCKETFSTFYRNVTAKPLFCADGSIDDGHLLFADTRTQVDGLYLRDPECILLREWARLDIDNSSLREGFTFTMTARSGGHGGTNENDYFLVVDPNTARRSNLYPVWTRLQAAEVAAWKKPENAKRRAQLREVPRDGYRERAGDLPELFSDPWYDGAGYGCRVIGTPDKGTLLAPGIDREFTDDAVAQIVQDELEFVIFKSPFRFHDVAARPGMGKVNQPLSVASARTKPPPVPEGRYRFGTVVLSSDVDLRSDVLAEQTARVLWRMLHPDQHEGPPAGLAEECCVREGGMLGVWSTSGVMIAHKSWANVPAREQKSPVRELKRLFRKLAKLARGVDRLIAKYSADEAVTAGPPAEKGSDPQAAAGDVRLREALRSSRELTCLMVDVRQAFGLPEGHVIERFARRSGLFETINVLRDANRSEQTQSNLNLTERLTGATETVAGVQLKLEWLELIFVGIYSTELANIIAEHALPRSQQLVFTMAVALALTYVAARFLKPWEGHGGKAGRWLMSGFAVLIALGIFLGALSAFSLVHHEPLPVVMEQRSADEQSATERKTQPPPSPRSRRANEPKRAERGR